MKTTLYFTLTLITFVTLMFVPNSLAQDDSPEYVVRVIYFIPTDREPDPNMNEKLDTLLKESQDFYADQMEAHGFGRKTFRFEADDAGNVVVHHINGKFNEAYYQNPSSLIVWKEIETQFDMSKNIYLCALDISSNGLNGTSIETGEVIYGLASGDSLKGRALIPASFFGATIHELGHTFGLQHDSRRDANRIFTEQTRKDWGIFTFHYWMTTSYCAAEWLDANRYFNPTQKAFNEDTRVQMLTLTLDSPPVDIRLRFEVTDPDGIHQVQLCGSTLSSSPFLIDYKSLSSKHATVEFVTNELMDVNVIILKVIDVNGNYTQYSFPIDITDYLPPPEVISIPDVLPSVF